MFAIYVCRVCRLHFEWVPIRPYVVKNYERMVELGTLDREAITGNPIKPVKFHPKYFHPMCPVCGGFSDWLWARR